MKLARTRSRSSIAFNMTPMIDIVFLLIIFFMTVSQITKISRHTIQLPIVSRTDELKEAQTFQVTIDVDGHFIVDGEPFELPPLVAQVARRQKSLDDPTSLAVAVKCDKRAPSRPLNLLVTRLGELRIKSIRTSVLQDQ